MFNLIYANMNIDDLKNVFEKEFKDYIVGIKLINNKSAEFDNFEFYNKELNEYLNSRNFKLYKHQAEALNLL
ncbi:hypothetical protein [Candidatus Nanopusillus massiliensis]|uniref:hypothetical protein n=1 Tax=Candidatus Nanopusillus massiliensis TaxID=2897163 RepID=UPI001E5337FC|nr:hypothetical protein [Candidatus Nanopusillus massiliensis]